MTRPVLLMVILAIAVGTISGVTGLFFKVGISFAEPHPIKILSTPLLTPEGSNVEGHIVVKALGKRVFLEEIELTDKNGNIWKVSLSVNLSSNPKPISFVLNDAVSYFPIGFDYTGIIITNVGTTYTLFSSMIPSTSPSAVEWSQFMFDPQNSGYVGGYTPSRLNGELWKIPIADSQKDVKGGPIWTSKGIVLIVDDGGDPRVYLVDPSSGEIRSNFILRGYGRPIFGPVAANGIIYFSTEYYVLAVDPATGEIVWRVSQEEIGEDYLLMPAGYPFYGYYGYLAALDSKVFLFTLYHNWTEDPDEPYKLAAMSFDAETGRIIWKEHLEHGSQDWFWRASSPKVDDGKVWFVDGLGHVWGLNPNDGSVYFYLDLGEENDIAFFTSPAYYEGFIYYFSKNGYIICVDTRNKTLAWKHKIFNPDEEQTVSSPVIINDIVYAASQHRIRAYRYDTGDLLWSHKINNLESPIIATKNYVYVIDNSYLIYIYNATSGELIFRWPYGWYLGDVIAWGTTLFLYKGIVYTIDDYGYMHALIEL